MSLTELKIVLPNTVAQKRESFDEKNSNTVIRS